MVSFYGGRHGNGQGSEKEERYCLLCGSKVEGAASFVPNFRPQIRSYQVAEEAEIALRNGSYVANELPNAMWFKDALAKYLAEVSAQKASSTHRRETHQSRSLKFFDGKQLGEITPTLAAQFRDKRLVEVMPATVIKDLNLLSHIFSTAIREWGIEVTNPVSIIRKPKTPPGRLRFLTEGEINKLLEESRKSHRSNLFHYILLQLHTGMRPSVPCG